MGYTGGSLKPRKEEAAFYGKDVFFDGNTRVAAAGDYDTIEGPDNLWRALNRRLAIAPGEYAARPNYGVGMKLFTKKPLTTSLKGELKGRITTQFLRDPRVSSVLEVSIDDVETTTQRFVRVVVRIESRGLARTLQPFLFAREAV